MYFTTDNHIFQMTFVIFSTFFKRLLCCNTLHSDCQLFSLIISPLLLNRFTNLRLPLDFSLSFYNILRRIFWISHCYMIFSIFLIHSSYIFPYRRSFTAMAFTFSIRSGGITPLLVLLYSTQYS